MKNSKIIKAVRLFALAAMFMVLAPSALSAQGTIGPNVPDANGIFLSKKVTSFDYSTLSGTLSLEAFVTGDMKKSLRGPLDFLLVLDNSSSLYPTNSPYSESSKYHKMRYAVNDMLTTLQAAKSEGGDIRVGIVIFSDKGKTSTEGGPTVEKTKALTEGFVSPDADIINTIKTNFSNDKFSVQNYSGNNTYIDGGMEIAKDMVAANSGRQGNTIVILFTDGQPTGNGNALTQAKTTLDHAKSIKDTGAKLYTVGLVSESDEKKKFYYSGSECQGWYKDQSGNQSNTPLTMKMFLSHISSQYPLATITSCGVGSNQGGNFYYLKYGDKWDTATTETIQYYRRIDEGNLSSIFENIMQEHASPAISLPSTTILKDFFSTSCSLGDPSGIKTYYALPVSGSTADGYVFDNRQHPTSGASGNYADIKNVAVSVKGSGSDSHVEVTGFDYSKYCVTKDNQGAYHGCELLVDIPFKFNDISAVTVDTDGHYIFNTNAPVSGLYEKDGSDPMAGPGGSQLTFEVPSVRYVELVVKTSGLKNIAGDPDAGIPASQESAMFKIERKTGESTYEEIGIVSLTGKDASGSAVTSAVMPLDPDGTYRVTPLSGWGWTYSVTPINGSDQPKKASAGANQVVFEYQATKSADIQTGNNEKVKSNKFN